MTGDMRRRIRDGTSARHDALHRDRVLARLLSPRLSLSDYRTCLCVFWRFYASLERQRRALDCWPDLGLAADVCALEADLPFVSPLGNPSLHLSTPEAMLGALYVAHGAAFGRNSMRANVLAALPTEPHAFIRRRADHLLWHRLLHQLEQIGSKAGPGQAVEDGAAQAFDFMASLTAAEGFLLTA